MDFGASEVMESEVLYDCVICGQSGPSTEDRPFGLVVLLQASSGMPCISHSVLKFRNAELKQMFCVLTRLFSWLAIVSLIIRVISVRGCIPITLKGNLS